MFVRRSCRGHACALRKSVGVHPTCHLSTVNCQLPTYPLSLLLPRCTSSIAYLSATLHKRCVHGSAFDLSFISRLSSLSVLTLSKAQTLTGYGPPARFPAVIIVLLGSHQPSAAHTYNSFCCLILYCRDARPPVSVLSFDVLPAEHPPILLFEVHGTT